MTRIALVFSFNPSAWISCQKIVTNLAESYHLLENESEVEVLDLHYTGEMSAFEILGSVRKLLKFSPTHVVFIDHKPHPLPFLNLFFYLFRSSSGSVFTFREKKELPKIIFHLFGDFTLNFQNWQSLERALKNTSVLFYGASSRQTKMLSEFIPAENLDTCPFPVSRKEFYFSEDLRWQLRDKHHWGKEKVFIYTGRLSRQKQILELLTMFANWLVESKAHARLVLVGDFDEIGEPYTDRGEWTGEYFQEVYKVHSEFEESVRSKIQFTGFKSNEELIAYYCAADIFINISVHNDEDYGMSCAEALACGLPLILTDWAGFSSFASPGVEPYISYIPVKISASGKETDFKALKVALNRASEENFAYSREVISSRSFRYTSVEAVAEKISPGLQQNFLFSAFDPFLKTVAIREAQFNRSTFYNHRERKYNENYIRTYRHYVNS